MSRPVHPVWLTLLLLVPLGCKGNGPRPVKGMITLEGAPVAGATVLFMPEDPTLGKPASGYTAPDGSFRLTTFKTADGALPGDYRILVKKTEAAPDPREANLSARERAIKRFEQKKSQSTNKTTLPKQYAEFESTPLRCKVPAEGVVTFDLRDDSRR